MPCHCQHALSLSLCRGTIGQLASPVQSYKEPQLTSTSLDHPHEDSVDSLAIFEIIYRNYALKRPHYLVSQTLFVGCQGIVWYRSSKSAVRLHGRQHLSKLQLSVTVIKVSFVRLRCLAAKEKSNIQKQHFQELLNCHRPAQPSVCKWVREQQHDIPQDPPSDEVPTLPEIPAAVSALKN